MNWNVKTAEIEKERSVLRVQVWNACQAQDLKAAKIIAFGYLSVSNELADNCFTADAYRALAYIYFAQGASNKQEASLRRAVELDSASNNLLGLTASVPLLAHYYLLHDKNELANDHLKKFCNSETIGQVYQFISSYPKIDKKEKMLDYYYVDKVT